MSRATIGPMQYAITVLLGLWTGFASAEAPNFQVHYIRENPTWLTSAHQVTLADLDNDGDLDWTVGNVHQKPNFYWYEYQAPDRWLERFIDNNQSAYGGACAMDVNGDEWIDLITSGNLYLNQGRGARWLRYDIGTSDRHCHDMQAVDLNQDEKLDIIANSDQLGLCWYESPKDPRDPWTMHEIGGKDYRAHGCANPECVADLDGDDDLDVAAARAWFENVDGKGLQWKRHDHKLIGQQGPWGLSVKTACRDLDGDGDVDIVQSECDVKTAARIGWLENTDGRGTFTVHWIKEEAIEDFHTLAVIDYDNDGDWDVFSAVGPLAKESRRTYLFENLSGENKKPEAWKEHVVLDGPLCHEGLAGDVDGDGDVDLVIKGWTSGPFIYLENLLISTTPKPEPPPVEPEPPVAMENEDPPEEPEPAPEEQPEEKPEPVDRTAKGLAAHWTFDEASGPSAADVSGNRRHAALYGPSRASGKLGSVVIFDGKDDRADAGAFDVDGEAMSIAAWCKPLGLDHLEDGAARIVSKSRGEKEEDHFWMLSLWRDGKEVRLRFRLKTDGTTSTLVANTGNVPLGEWVHTAAVYDGKAMKLFLDGKQVGRVAKTGPIDADDQVAVWIGDNPPTAGARSWHGLMDDVRIYDRALSPREVRILAKPEAD